MAEIFQVGVTETSEVQSGRQEVVPTVTSGWDDDDDWGSLEDTSHTQQVTIVTQYHGLIDDWLVWIQSPPGKIQQKHQHCPFAVR